MEITQKICNLLIENGFHSINLMEKSHLALGLLDNLCHEIVYHQHESLDYTAMTDICINAVVNILNHT